MGFVTDGFCIRTGCCNEKIQRLHPSVARALGHNIKELPVRLCMQLIENNSADIESVLGVGFRRQHLIKAVCRLINDAFGSGQNFDALVQGRAHPYHVGGNIKNDGGLLSVGGTAVNLRTFLTVAAA